jgi:hypothetical protein
MQRVVTEFLTAEGYSPIEIHRRLKSVYDEAALGVGSDRRWVRRFKSGENYIGDRSCSHSNDDERRRRRRRRKKHLCGTSPAQWKRPRCSSVKKNYETLVHH